MRALFYICLFFNSLVFTANTSLAQSFEFKPFKDELFVYAKLLETKYAGAFRKFEYDELRDVNGRDRMPGKTAKSKYVSRVKGGIRQLAVTGSNGLRVPYYTSGNRGQTSKFTVIYIHGNGGNRKQGINIRSFGGNFGRLQNLLAEAGGRYISPGFSDFGTIGEAQIGLLVQRVRSASPKSPIVLACGSQGSLLCWRLAKSTIYGKDIDGLVILGGWTDDALLQFDRLVPVYLAHGSRDKIAPWELREKFLLRMLKHNKDYPIRMDLFDGGIHGTPIRMIDWREVLNWMASQIGR